MGCYSISMYNYKTNALCKNSYNLIAAPFTYYKVKNSIIKNENQFFFCIKLSLEIDSSIF